MLQKTVEEWLGERRLAPPLPSPPHRLLRPLFVGSAIRERFDIEHLRAQASAPRLGQHSGVCLGKVAQARPRPVVEADDAAARSAAENGESRVRVVVVLGVGVKRHVPSHDPTLRDSEYGSGGTVFPRNDGAWGHCGRRWGGDNRWAALGCRTAATGTPSAVHRNAVAAASTGNSGDATHQLVDGRNHRAIRVAKHVRPPLGVDPDDLAPGHGHLRDQASGGFESRGALEIIEGYAGRLVLRRANLNVALHDPGPFRNLPPAADVLIAIARGRHSGGNRQSRARARRRRVLRRRRWQGRPSRSRGASPNGVRTETPICLRLENRIPVLPAGDDAVVVRRRRVAIDPERHARIRHRARHTRLAPEAP